MSDQVFEKSTTVPRPAQATFSWLASMKTLPRVLPPWERITILRGKDSVAEGSEVTLRAHIGPFQTQWKLVHREVDEDRGFCNVQVDGPFSHWSHRHSVVPNGPAESEVIDHVQYRVPGGALGALVFGGWIRRRIRRFFDFAHSTMRDDLAMASRYGSVRPLRVMVAGASGLVGTALRDFLHSQGHEVVPLVRGRSPRSVEVAWDPETGSLDPHAFRGIDAVVNLAGESIAGGRWSEERKRRLWESRIKSTRTLVEALSHAKHRPYVFVNASGVGVYGNSGDSRLYEDAPLGDGFLADLCDAWETEARGAEQLGIRTALLRFGTVVTAKGGALPRLLLPYRLGFGGRLGPANNWVSWISLDDVVGAIYHSLLDMRCTGAVNAVAPGGLRQAEWAAVIGRVLRRPVWLPVPGWILRLILGEMAEEALLTSTRVQPGVLQQSGYVFRHPNLQSALCHTLGRRAKATAAEPTSGPRRGRRAGA